MPTRSPLGIRRATFAERLTARAYGVALRRQGACRRRRVWTSRPTRRSTPSCPVNSSGLGPRPPPRTAANLGRPRRPCTRAWRRSPSRPRACLDPPRLLRLRPPPRGKQDTNGEEEKRPHVWLDWAGLTYVRNRHMGVALMEHFSATLQPEDIMDAGDSTPRPETDHPIVFQALRSSGPFSPR